MAISSPCTSSNDRARSKMTPSKEIPDEVLRCHLERANWIVVGVNDKERAPVLSQRALRAAGRTDQDVEEMVEDMVLQADDAAALADDAEDQAADEPDANGASGSGSNGASGSSRKVRKATGGQSCSRSWHLPLGTSGGQRIRRCVLRHHGRDPNLSKEVPKVSPKGSKDEGLPIARLYAAASAPISSSPASRTCSRGCAARLASPRRE